MKCWALQILVWCFLTPTKSHKPEKACRLVFFPHTSRYFNRYSVSWEQKATHLKKKVRKKKQSVPLKLFEALPAWLPDDLIENSLYWLILKEPMGELQCSTVSQSAKLKDTLKLWMHLIFYYLLSPLNSSFLLSEWTNLGVSSLHQGCDVVISITVHL